GRRREAPRACRAEGSAPAELVSWTCTDSGSVSAAAPSPRRVNVLPPARERGRSLRDPPAVKKSASQADIRLVSIFAWLSRPGLFRADPNAEDGRRIAAMRERRERGLPGPDRVVTLPIAAAFVVAPTLLPL